MSQAQRGKQKSEIHKQRISQALKDYWSKVPSQPTTSTNTTYQGNERIKNNDINANGNDNI